MFPYDFAIVYIDLLIIVTQYSSNSESLSPAFVIVCFDVDWCIACNATISFSPLSQFQLDLLAGFLARSFSLM